jgi:hypothetical protein
MAATTLAKDVLYRVSGQLTDAPTSADQFIRWTERELVNWLNDGQRVIATYLPSACSRIDAIKLVTGTRQSIETVLAANIKPGDGSTAATVKGKILLDVVRNMGSDGLTPGRAIRVVSRDVLDQSNPDWHTETDSEITEYVFDQRTPKYFYVSPGASSSGDVWVEVSHLVNPTDVAYVADSMRFDGASTTLISIDDQFIDLLVNYMLARAHMKEAESAGNAAIAAAHINIFTSSINSQSMVLTGVNPNLKMLPMTPQIPAAAS